MAEFQWWLLIVGLVAGGGIVAAVYMDGRRDEADVDEEELQAEATWIAARLAPLARDLEARTVEAVLRAHRQYLSLPPPDRLEPVGPSDGDADGQPDNVGDRGGRGADEDLAPAGVQEATAGEQADPGPDGEQRPDR